MLMILQRGRGRGQGYSKLFQSTGTVGYEIISNITNLNAQRFSLHFVLYRTRECPSSGLFRKTKHP